MVKYRSLEELTAEVQMVTSLVVHATTGDRAAAFARGAGQTGLALALIEPRDLKIAAIKTALARLNQLAPMEKPRRVKALTHCALFDGQLSLTEAELMRAVCATLDSPLPPFIETMPSAI